LPKETEVLVIIPSGDESEMGLQLREAANATFRKLWDNEADEVWNESLYFSLTPTATNARLISP
jgi:hypothetical protein